MYLENYKGEFVLWVEWKLFFIYLLLFVGLYVVSNLLIDAYIKTSYYKIETYDIDVKEANITIMTAKASKMMDI